MITWRTFVEPFAKLPKSAAYGLLAAEAVVALVAWHLSGDGLIPDPLKVGTALMKVVTSPTFMSNFIASLFLTFKGMGVHLTLGVHEWLPN